MSKKLWKEVNGERQFLVPEGIPLEAGKLEIENSSGDRMMVSEHSIIEHLASEKDVEDYQDQAVEETIAELGKAFSSLFQAGKDIFSQAFQTEDDSEEESATDSESENVIDIDFENNDKEDSEGFFSELGDIFQASKTEFQSIFQEAKQEFTKTLRDKETTELLTSIGQQIIDFANNLKQEDSQTEDSSSDADDSEITRNSNNIVEDIENNEPPLVANGEHSQSEENDEDSNDVPPSPLSDNNE